MIAIKKIFNKLIIYIFLMMLVLSNNTKALDLEVEVLSNNYEPHNVLISDFYTTRDTSKYFNQLKDIIIEDLEGSGMFLVRSTFDNFVGEDDDVVSASLDLSNYMYYDSSLAGKFLYDKNSKEYIIEYIIVNNSTQEIKAKYGYRVHRKYIGKELSIIAHEIANDYFQAVTGSEGYFNANLVYANGNKLVIADYDGKNSKVLATNSGRIYGPVVSSSGEFIAYVNFENGLSSIYLYNVLDGSNTKMANLKGLSLSPRFSRDDKELVFSQVREGSTNIFRIDLEKYKVKALTNSYSINLAGGFSVKNDMIIFNSDRIGNPHIYSMDNNGKNVKRISKGKGAYYTPSFGINNDIILFTKIVGQKFYIGLLNLDGEEKIISEDLFVESPSWVADDRHIIYQYKYSGDNYAFYLMDLISGYKKRIIPSENSKYPYISKNVAIYSKSSVKYEL